MGAVVFMFSCSVKYEDQNKEVVKSQEVPDTMMENFKLIKMKKNVPYVEVLAKKAEIFDSQNRTLLYNTEFIEYDGHKQNVVTRGKADIVEYFNDTENATLTGNLNFYSKKEEIEISGESILWNSDLKSIGSGENDLMFLKKDDGSILEGYGFNADLKHSTFFFSGSVNGEIP